MSMQILLQGDLSCTASRPWVLSCVADQSFMQQRAHLSHADFPRPIWKHCSITSDPFISRTWKNSKQWGRDSSTTYGLMQEKTMWTLWKKDFGVKTSRKTSIWLNMHCLLPALSNWSAQVQQLPWSLSIEAVNTKCRKFNERFEGALHEKELIDSDKFDVHLVNPIGIHVHRRSRNSISLQLRFTKQPAPQKEQIVLGTCIKQN